MKFELYKFRKYSKPIWKYASQILSECLKESIISGIYSFFFVIIIEIGHLHLCVPVSY